MKKLLYGSIALCLFAIALTITQLSCQKTIAQTATPGDDGNNYILYEKSSEVKIPVITQTDSGAFTTYLTYSPFEFYTSDLNGNNEVKIPITLPDDLYAINGAKFTTDGKTIIFNVATKPTESDNNPQQCYIYSCALDGSNLKKIRDNCGFSDVH